MKVAVIGAGWLGFSLCKALQKQGIEVVASKRDREQAEKLTFEGLDTFVYQLGAKLPEALQACSHFVINIGAGRRGFEKQRFEQQMQELLRQCLAKADKRLLFISTTSVYGEANKTFTEDTLPEPISDSAKAHVAIEQFLKDNFPEQASILRLAGLIAEDRHPVYYLEGKKDITAAHKMVNLVHRDDAVAAILAVLDKQLWGEVFHLCATSHPTRRNYYTKAAEILELVPPMFLDNSDQPATGKCIDPDATLQKLELTLQYSSPFDMLPQEVE
ncbi:NAD-dependent epimerase/dehydratase family protein [Planctobacterium marinum]|uniref:NAD(P)-dependent oxidoreductase n=1 Tax=Planctobacterium marinum TaxID=1631968 RepID=A0AA48HT07_9ALTE|nr:NAD(P)-dependent oxidoreductase [Planctobacterium marinum]